MANTFTASTGSCPLNVVGNMRMVAGVLTMTDAGTGQVATGLDYIYGGSLTPITCNTNGGGLVINYSANGSVLAASCTSGDNFYLVAFGR